MFQEVRRAIGFVGFGSAASIDPYTHSRRLSPWRMLSRNLDQKSVHRKTEDIGHIGNTVKPFESVVHSVWVGSRGVAKPRLADCIDANAFRLRKARLKL